MMMTTQRLLYAGTLAALPLLGVPGSELVAQQVGQFRIFPRVSYVAFDDAAGIQDPVLNSDLCGHEALNVSCTGAGENVFIGGVIIYKVTPLIGVGVAVDFGRPVTNGTYFPAASLRFPDGTQLTFVNQRLSILQYGAEVELEQAVGRLRVFGAGGLGGYTVYLDPEKSKTFDRFSEVQFSIGGGVDLGISETAGFRIELRDVIYTGWDRELLNAVGEDFQDTTRPDLVPVPPDASGTLHNFRLAIGFTFLPRGGR